MAEHSQRYLRRTFLAVREHAGVSSYKFKCVHSNSPGRPSLTYPQLSAFFFSSSLSSSSDLSITRPLRLLPALRQPLTKRQCLNGFASTADMAVSVPEITPVPCLSHWEMMEGPWQSKGRENGQRAGEDDWLIHYRHQEMVNDCCQGAHYDVFNASIPLWGHQTTFKSQHEIETELCICSYNM